MSEIEVNAEDLQAVIMELQAENSNLRLVKAALSRKVKEQAFDAQVDQVEKVIPFEKES
jgi:regulator of replication initiation timing